MGRDEFIALTMAASRTAVCNQEPYDQLAHRVDRVIKRRDVLVARRI
jgi:hypothetical protein